MLYRDLKTALQRPNIMVFIATELTPGHFAWIVCTKAAVQNITPGLQDDDEIVGHVDQQGCIFIGRSVPQTHPARANAGEAAYRGVY